MSNFPIGSRVKFVVPRTTKSYPRMNSFAIVKMVNHGEDDYVIEFEDDKVMVGVQGWQVQNAVALNVPKGPLRCPSST